jgi:putative inorganic carbon (hco3(-)) transporter
MTTGAQFSRNRAAVVAHGDFRSSLPVYLAGAAAVMTMVSIAAFEILLGLALVAVLISPRESARGLISPGAPAGWRWPPVLAPLGLWIGLTLLSLAASGHMRAGYPQVRKMYVFLMLILVYGAVRTLAQVRSITLGWAIAGSASAAWGLEQFVRKYRAAAATHADFYTSYVADRITGFMGHWMTFSGHMMIALLMIGALLLFGRARETKPWSSKEVWSLAAASALVSVALLAAETRSMWGGAALGVVYLLWMKRPWLILAAPIAVGCVLLANPFAVRERAVSIVRPNKNLDSNAFRGVARTVGWEMIKAHPWLGVGPEQVGPQFDRYADIAQVARPLPPGYYGHLHNIYFHFAAERGLPALAALLWMVGKALLDFARGLRRLAPASDKRWVLNGAIAVILAVMSSGFYEVNLGDSEVLGAFLAVVAIGYSALHAAEPESAA